MPNTTRRSLAAALLLSCAAAAPAAIVFDELTSGLITPLFVTNAGDGSNRLFVLEQEGRIRVISGTTVSTFLDITTRTDAVSERGLLGLAFDPNYESNGFFYIHYNRSSDGGTIVARYTATPPSGNVANFNSELIIHGPVSQPQDNHKGGSLEFGPDGFLYLALGDGGGAGDNDFGHTPGIGNGQDINSELGKILRFSVNGTAAPGNPFAGATPGNDFIYAYGLRNPFRFSFDRITSRLFCGDVGQNRVEEIDIITVGDNLGWRVKEGNECFNVDNFDVPLTSCIDPPNYQPPIHTYSHAVGNAVIGGYVYRGVRSPAIEGRYVYGDFGTGQIWRLTEVAPGSWSNALLADTDFRITSFGEDDIGELYLCVQSMGRILRIRDTTLPAADRMPPGTFTFDENDFGTHPLGEDFVHDLFASDPALLATVNAVADTSFTAAQMADFLVGPETVGEPDGGLLPSGSVADDLEAQTATLLFNTEIPDSEFGHFGADWVLNGGPVPDLVNGAVVLRTPPTNSRLVQLGAERTSVQELLNLAAEIIDTTNGGESQTLSRTLNGVPLTVAQLITVLQIANESFNGGVPTGAVLAP